jgi:arylsulfatase A-like enzyme
MPTQPNIVLILLDDMGQRDLGCYGSTFYETPNIDRLASRGMRFDNAYASCPVCSPTRASIMTGQYPARVGITNYIPGNACGRLLSVPYFQTLPSEHVTVAEALRQGGYQTWHVGKWHLGRPGHWPEDFGFEVNIAGSQHGSPPNGYFSPYHIPTLSEGPPGEYLTDRLTDESIRLIEERDPARPFFLNLWHYAVHTPIEAPHDLVEKYRRKARDLGLDTQQALQPGEFFPCLHKKDERIVRRLIQSDPAYAAMIENLDTNVGRLLAALAQAGLEDNTLVVFTSDNGGLSTAEGSPTTNLPLCEGKGWMYDGGIREPLIACGPGIAPAGVCDEPVTSTDFYPTFLDMAGLPPRPHQHADGLSLVPLLRGQDHLERQAIYWHYPHYSNQGDTPACAVRSGDWKLIEFFETGRLELYNLTEDIGEERELSTQRPEITQRLHDLLIRWRTDIEAKIPQPNPDYDQMLAGTIPIPPAHLNLPIPGDDRQPATAGDESASTCNG